MTDSLVHHRVAVSWWGCSNSNSDSDTGLLIDTNSNPNSDPDSGSDTKCKINNTLTRAPLGYSAEPPRWGGRFYPPPA